MATRTDAPRMTEAAFQAAVYNLARARGYAAYHTHRSTRSERGFPDLVLVPSPYKGTGATIYAELKSAAGTLEPEQAIWLTALRESGGDCYIWYPRHWPEAIVAVLAGRGPTIPHNGKLRAALVDALGGDSWQRHLRACAAWRKGQITRSQLRDAIGF